VSCEQHVSKTVFRLWDAKTAKLLSQFNGDHVCAIACAPDNENVVAGNSGGSIGVWELTEGKLLRRVSVPSKYLGAIALGQDGLTVAWADTFVGFGAIDIKSAKNLFTPGPLSWQPHRIALTPDNRVLATAGKDVCLWEVATGQKLATWAGLWAGDVAFSADGRLLAAATDKGIALWDVAAGQEVLRFTGHQGRTRRVVFAPHGRMAVTALPRMARCWSGT
jgi:WD40 repeat protein